MRPWAIGCAISARSLKAALGELQAKVARLKQGMLEAKWSAANCLDSCRQSCISISKTPCCPNFRSFITVFPQGARTGIGECCAPKLLYAANRLLLRPIAIAEFWWGPGTEGSCARTARFIKPVRSAVSRRRTAVAALGAPSCPSCIKIRLISVVDKPTCLLTVPV